VIDIHAQAVLDLLTAAIASPRKVFDGQVDPPVADVKATPYVLAYFDAARPDLNFQGATYTFQLRITCHSVGANAQAARRVAQDAAAALLDVSPTVSGRKCYPIRWEEGTPPQRDESTGVTVMDQIDTYVLRSVPA
jgi:hypothetical protein